MRRLSVRLARSLASCLLLITTMVSVQAVLVPSTAHAAAPTTNGPCEAGDFFGLPRWYKYLEQEYHPEATPGKPNGFCTVKFNSGGNPLMSFWLVGFAVLELLLRLVGVLAVGFVIYGGIRYITSQGSPENTKAARNTIINALAGAAIAIIASISVSFIAGKLAP